MTCLCWLLPLGLDQKMTISLRAADSFIIFLSVYSFLSFLFNILMHLMLTVSKWKRQGFLLKTSCDFTKLSPKNSIKIIEVQSGVFVWPDRFPYFLSNDQAIQFLCNFSPSFQPSLPEISKARSLCWIKELGLLDVFWFLFLCGSGTERQITFSAPECHLNPK